MRVVILRLVQISYGCIPRAILSLLTWPDHGAVLYHDCIDSRSADDLQVKQDLSDREALGSKYAQMAAQYGANQQLIRDLKQA